MILLGKYCSWPFAPTITLVLRNPPTGSPFAGEVLVEAVLAAALNASIVLPVVGLKFQLVFLKQTGLELNERVDCVHHSSLAMGLYSLGTVDPDWLGIIDSDCESCRRCSGGIFCRHKAREETSWEKVAWILET